MKNLSLITGITIISLFWTIGTVYGEDLLRYKDNGDGSINDLYTGLMWQYKDDDQTRNWENALTYCEDLHLAGYDDWRLPDIRELRSLVERALNDPAIENIFLPYVKSAAYWSSTTSVSYTSKAWLISFSSGLTDWSDKTNELYARCVRGL